MNAPPLHPPGSRLEAAAFPLALLVVAAVYLPGAAYDLVFDDSVLIVENTLLGKPGSLLRLWTVDLWSTAPADDTGSLYYRPVFLLSLWLDRALAGLSTTWAHLHSLLWHLGVVGMVGLLARRGGAGPLAVAGGVLMSGLHPAQVETVQLVAARNDSMALGFVLLATLAALSHRGHAPLALVAVAAAVLSKEAAALAPGVVGLLVWACAGDTRRALVGTAWSGAGVLVAGLARAVAGVGFPAGAGADALAAAVWPSLTWYANVLIWPVGLAPGAHRVWLPSPSVLPLVLLVGMLWAAIVWGGRRVAAAVVAAALWTGPALVGVAHARLLPDRYLYGAIILGGLVLAWTLQQLPRARTVVRAGAPIGAAVLLGVLTRSTLPAWASDRALWNAAVAEHPSPFSWGALDKTLELEGETQPAARLFEQAVSVSPTDRTACFNAARVQLLVGSPADAARVGEMALANGCPPTPELVAPTAIGHAVMGAWGRAEVLAQTVGADPTGQAVLVRCAAAALRRDRDVLEAASAAGRGDPAVLQQQVAWLLDQAGERTAADWIRGPSQP